MENFEERQGNNSSEAEIVQYALKLIRFFARNQSRDNNQQYHDNKHSVLSSLVNRTKKLQDMRSQQIKKFYNEEGSIVNVIRVFLTEPQSSLRSNAIKFFRLILESEKISLQYIQYSIPIFIARSLERETKTSSDQRSNNSSSAYQEIDQSLKFIKKWIEVTPKTFPKLLANSLVAFSENAEEQIKQAAIEIIRKLAVGNPQLCAWSGGIKLLIECVIDHSLQELSNPIIHTLLYLLNESEFRNLVKVYLDFPKLFGVFTDIDAPSRSIPKTQSQEENRREMEQFEKVLNLAKKAIITMLKTWKGLIYLGNQRIAMKSLIQTLRQPIHDKIRNAIYDIIGELLAIGGKECVPNKLSVQNFLNYYLMILIQFLLDCDLFTVLVELSGLEDEKKSLRAQEQLKQLTTLMFNLIPNCQKYTDFLISAANQCNESLTDLKAWSSNIVSIMGNYVFEQSQKGKKVFHSKFIYQCENFYLFTQLGLPCHRINKQIIQKIKLQNESVLDDQNFERLFQDTNIQREYSRWNWNSILEIVQTYIQTKWNELKNRFVRKLLVYFHPHQQQFISLEWRDSNFIQAKVGYLLIQNLLKFQESTQILNTPPSDMINVNRSFMGELFHLLVSEVNSEMVHPASFLLKPSEFNEKMIREYISWIGLFSQSANGLKLLKEAKIWETLNQYVDSKGKRDHILILIIYCLDYGKQKNSIEFLQYCLDKGSFHLQNSALELIRLLNRSEFIDFFERGIDMLVQKLNHTNQPEIRQKALNVVKEVIQNEGQMQVFLSKNPNLQDLCDDNDPFLITLLQTEKGFDYLQDKYDWVNLEFKRWQESEKVQYVTKVEKCLLNALNFVESDEQYIYRFPDIVNNAQNSFFALGFIHRMPWIMNVDFSTNEFKDSVSFLVSVEYQGQQNPQQFILCGRPTPFSPYSEQDRYVIPFNQKFQINFNLSVGKSFIDKNCNESPDPQQIPVRCDFQDSKLFEKIDKHLVIKKGGIHFMFIHDEIANTVKLTQIKLYMKVAENKSQSEKIPQHFFGELVKTQKGLQLLKSNKIIEKCVDDIRNNNLPILNKRASLWTIGHIGYSKQGITLIHQLGEKQYKSQYPNQFQNQIVQDLVILAEQSDILSLRGTCLYILNMLANTEIGRDQLKELDWVSHWNQNIGWLATPNNMRQFFYIRNTHKEGLRTYWPNQNENWDRYISFQKKMIYNEDQNKLLQNIALMSNALSSKNASMEIKKIYKTNPGLFEDKVVIYSVILMLDFYKFRFENRKFIFNFFEKAFSNSDIFTILDQNPYNHKQSL